MAEGRQRIRLHGETKGAICGFQYMKFRVVRGGGNHTASKRNSARGFYFEFARYPFLKTLKAIDKSVNAIAS